MDKDKEIQECYSQYEYKSTSMRHMYCMRFVEVFLVIAVLNRVQIDAISLKQGYNHSPAHIEKNGNIWYIFHYMEKELSFNDAIGLGHTSNLFGGNGGYTNETIIYGTECI